MAQKRVIVTSERPEGHAKQLQDAKNKQKAVAAGTTGISVANYIAASTAADIAQTAMRTRAPGTAKARNDAFQEMFEEEDKVIADLQKKVDDLAGGIEAKIALALSNGFQVQDLGSINKQNFVVKDGPTSGSNKLVAKSSRDKRTFHEWQDSIDKGITWRYIQPTVQASRVCDGYDPGQLVKYRHRMVDKDGPKEWDYAEIITR